MKTGTQLFWTISEFSTTPEKLSDLGFADFVPRNDFRSAMIKALHKHTKGNERLYRRFGDTCESVSFGVFLQTTNGSDMDMQKEVVLRVDKKSGAVQSVSEVPASLLSDYEAGKVTLSSNQIRSIVPRFIRESHGVSMRPSGGIYFVDSRFDEACVAKLEALFKALPGSKLYAPTMYNDKGALDSIEDAIAGTFQKEIDLLISEIEEGYKKGTLTAKQVENRKGDTVRILNELKIHEKNLRSKADSLVVRTKKISEILSSCISLAEGSMVESGDFASMLRSL